MKREKKNARYIPTYRFIDFMPSQQTGKREIEFKNFSFFYHFIICDDKLKGLLSASDEEEIAWKIGTEKVTAVDRAEKRGWKADLTPEGESCSAMTEAMKKREKRNTLREKKRASEEMPDTTSAAQRSTGQKRRGEGTDRSSHANENVWTDRSADSIPAISPPSTSFIRVIKRKRKSTLSVPPVIGYLWGVRSAFSQSLKHQKSHKANWMS
ncbi:hypothetical protein PROFUN_11702 [Planoprotostelium fungivorum]|uniref:Uncharacterized protein n=1 Tax=Planoprotostelium fungivorum TaxID=1890364 RepID=A0A2P6N969_9EUKA|nr:hypothetical protein PROFUN_11702 [Planoprotostelium fungivorum]